MLSREIENIFTIPEIATVVTCNRNLYWKKSQVDCSIYWNNMRTIYYNISNNAIMQYILYHTCHSTTILTYHNAVYKFTLHFQSHVQWYTYEKMQLRVNKIYLNTNKNNYWPTKLMIIIYSYLVSIKTKKLNFVVLNNVSIYILLKFNLQRKNIKL